MLSKDSIKTLVANSLYSFHDEILKDEFATKKYVDSKSLSILLLDDSNRTGDKLFPLLPEHNLVFIAGDAQFTDESGNINIIYGLCYSDLQSDGSKLLTEYRTSKSASISANGTLKSFDYIDEYTKTILTLFKNAPSGKVLVKSQNNTFEWVELPNTNGLATEAYVDNKTSMENIVFEGGADNPLVIFDYWTHCPLSNGNACWVIDKEVIIGENIKNPYYIEVNGIVYSPKNSTYDSVNNAWIYNDTKLNSGQKLYMCATYENQNKMVIPWDEMGNYNKLKVYTKTELATAISDGDSEATDEEVNAMLLEVLGGDYSVQN